ncbi:Hypothetical predicted protein [Mytilus galloprovincialis]|nr:Hypothetical predicted protein [Mytilus galloprovincialis]
MLIGLSLSYRRNRHPVIKKEKLLKSQRLAGAIGVCSFCRRLCFCKCVQRSCVDSSCCGAAGKPPKSFLISKTSKKEQKMVKQLHDQYVEVYKQLKSDK